MALKFIPKNKMALMALGDGIKKKYRQNLTE
jgi:hypothetical protein